MFALVNSLAAAGFAQNDVAKMLSELKKFGANGHLYIPGVGAISGITAGNYLDSTGTTNASVDGNVGLVKDQLGSLNATQATTGYQPKLRRGVVNLLTYSNDLSNVAWSKNAVSVAANKIVADTSTGYHSTSRGYVVPAGTNQTLAFLLSSAEYSKARLSDNSSGEWYCSVDLSTGAVSASGGARLVSAAAVKLSDGNVLAAVVVTGNGVVKGYAVAGYPNSGATLGIYGAQYTGDGVSGIYLYSMGIIQGALTAQQILAADGIPLTTTAPASSSAGAYKWEFDGTDDFMSLGSIPFQIADDHCVIAAVRPNSTNIGKHILNPANGAASQQVGCIRVDGASKYTASWCDDTTTVASVADSAALNVGESSVVTARKIGSVGALRKNGLQIGSTNLSAIGATTLTLPGVLGAFKSGAAASNIHLHGAAVIKGTVTDAQALIFERGLNAIAQYAAGRF